MSDSRFDLPDLEVTAAEEAGVILLGLDPDRLLAGLGFAGLADDPGLVAQIVDRARHGGFTTGHAELVDGGARRWRLLRPAVAAVPAKAASGGLRREWRDTAARVAVAVPDAGPAARAYLAACWIRREEIDRLTDREDLRDVVPQIPAG
ncbi:DUF6187 family protein [Amycolatopsis vastitatis]|uniref:Uncharacterized protein n=1 Tax=Amycolatopsis vastitatis TaxID=1905142 RepID=A0A229SL94_9PSEU|nr:DUF6187 family protein [Amycolatopsis vastitatis]OXM59623.1 hypothetical protein CF165_46905 [Amycolatopsis vastitatis]